MRSGGGWESCERRPDQPFAPLLATWRNQKYIVNLLRHPPYPGVDHLVVQRHDDGIHIPWSHLQEIKDSLLPDGAARWAIEVFPPADEVVDEANMRHLWVMPEGWRSPVRFGELSSYA